MANCWKCQQPLVHPECGPREVGAIGKCPVLQGALWVTVKGGGKDIEGVPIDVGNTPGKTGLAGLAHFEPLAEAKYTAVLGELPSHVAAEFDPPEDPKLSNIPVKPGKIASVAFTLRRRPNLVVTIAPNHVPVDVTLKLAEGVVETRKDCTASTRFEALKPGDYTIVAEVAAGHVDTYAGPKDAPAATLVYDADGNASIVLVERVKPTIDPPNAIALVGGPRVKLKLGTHVVHDGTGKLTLTGTPAAVKVHGAVDDKGGGVYEVRAVPGGGVELELEAVSASAFEGIGVEWALEGGTKPCAPAVKSKLTAAAVQLTIHDKDGVAIARDAAKDPARGRVVHLQDAAKARARAKLAITCDPIELSDRVELSARADKLGLHTADTGDAAQGLPLTKPPAELWVQGDKVSDTVGDCGLELAFDGVKVDEVACTVVQVKLEIGDVRPDPGPRPKPRVPWPDPGAPPLLGDDAKRDPGRALYVQGEQFMSPRARVRVLKVPHDAPCTLQLVRSGDQVRLFPRETDLGGGKTHSGEERLSSEAEVVMPREILPGEITVPADGLTFWAEGAQTLVGKLKLQIDIDGVDVECDHASFTVVPTFFEITVKRRDNAQLSAPITVELFTKQGGPLIKGGTVDPLTGKARIEAPPGAYLVSMALPAGESLLQILRGKLTPAPTEAGGDLEAAVQVKAIAETKLEYELAPKPVYTHVQFVGYRVKTGEYRGEDIKANHGDDIELASKHDILQRCEIMTQAVKDAEALPPLKLDKTATTLKIFVAPEFYFRGKLGAYPYEVVSMVLDEMRKETGTATYEDWLFVFGSAIGFFPTKDRVKHDGTTVTVAGVGSVLMVACQDASPSLAVDATWRLISTTNNVPKSNVAITGVVPAGQLQPGWQKRQITCAPAPIFAVGTPGVRLKQGVNEYPVRVVSKHRVVKLRVTCTTAIPAVGWAVEQGALAGLVRRVTPQGGHVYELLADFKLGPPPVTGADVELFQPGEAETINIAQVQRGGAGVPMNADGTRALKELLVYKEYISSVDFAGLDYGTQDFYAAERHQAEMDGVSLVRLLPTPGSRDVLNEHPNIPGQQRVDGSGTAKPAITSESTTSGLGGGSLFTMDDITFGLEVCLDHLKQKLKKYYVDTQAQVGERKPQIQLIPSCGMSIKQPSCVANLVFNVDANEHGASADTGATRLAAIGAPVTPNVPGTITITNFFVDAGQLVTYPKQLIPPVTVVV